MPWNYRLVRKNGCIGIHEVYYDEKRNVISCTEQPVRLSWEDDEDDNWNYPEAIQKCFTKPILNYEDIGNE